jgi:hypothetical protein
MDLVGLHAGLLLSQIVVVCWCSNEHWDPLMYKRSRFAHTFVQLKVNSTKSMIGHLLGASGGVEAIATVQVCKLRAICGWDMKVQVYSLELSSLKAVVPFCCVRCFSVKLLDRCNMDLVIGFHNCTLCLILILDYSNGQIKCPTLN